MSWLTDLLKKDTKKTSLKTKSEKVGNLETSTLVNKTNAVQKKVIPFYSNSVT